LHTLGQSDVVFWREAWGYMMIKYKYRSGNKIRRLARMGGTGSVPSAADTEVGPPKI